MLVLLEESCEREGARHFLLVRQFVLHFEVLKLQVIKAFPYFELKLKAKILGSELSSSWRLHAEEVVAATMERKQRGFRA